MDSIITDFGKLGGMRYRIRQVAELINQADLQGFFTDPDSTLSDGVYLFGHHLPATGNEIDELGVSILYVRLENARHLFTDPRGRIERPEIGEVPTPSV